MKLLDINNATLIWGVISNEGLDILKKENALVVIPENRPFMIGLKYNVGLLKQEGIKFVYCNDNALGFLFYKNKINKTIIFYKEKNEKGIFGITGSLYVGLLSKLHQVPVLTLEQGLVSSSMFAADVSLVGLKSFIIQEEWKKDCFEPEDELLIF